MQKHAPSLGRILAMVLFTLSCVGLLLFLAAPSLVRFYTDWLWFGEVGYQRVFLTMLQSQGTLFTVSFVLATVWLVLNLNMALAAIGTVRPVFTTREGIMGGLRAAPRATWRRGGGGESKGGGRGG